MESLKRWGKAVDKPLHIIQVFFDQAYVLPFATLLRLIAASQIETRTDPETNKATFFIPLREGMVLGNIPMPDVEGRIFVAPNGCVTVYGRLTGSEIQPASRDLIAGLMAGTLTT